MRLRGLGVLLVFFILTISLQAQTITPITGPVLAMNTVDQDAIVLYDVGTNRYRQLSFGIGAHHVWDFSPDGCRILFTHDDDVQGRRLYSMGLDGGAPLQMATYDDLAPENWGIWSPDWSSDGSRIAFTLQRQFANGDTTSHIAYVTTDNTEINFYSVTGAESSPVWSPNGEWLAYLSYQERIPGANVMATALPTREPPPGQAPVDTPTISEADLWVVSADDTLKYNLTSFDIGSVTQPRWSSDSELISFVWSPQNSSDMLWMIANQPAAIPTQISYEWSMILDSTWLPDNTAVIGAMREFRETIPNTLWQIPLVNTDDSLASTYLDTLNLSHADFPRFHASGEWLAVRSAYEMVLINILDNSTRLLNLSVLGNSAGVWSPTGFIGEQSC